MLVPITGVLWWLWRRSLDPLAGWRSQVDADLLRAMTIDEGPRWSDLGYGLLGTWILAIVVIAGPTWRLEPNPFAADAIPLLILLKADASMDPPESSPTALEQAQLKITDLVEIRKGQPVGLIAYAGSAHLVLPPTKDSAIVAQLATELSSQVMPRPGDRLDLALQKANDLLSREQSSGAILVIANSVETEPGLIAQAYEEVKPYPISFLALRDNESLKAAAGKLEASVEVMTPDDQDLKALLKTADRQSSRAIAGETQRWREAGYWLLPLIAVLIVASFRREAQKKRKKPK